MYLILFSPLMVLNTPTILNKAIKNIIESDKSITAPILKLEQRLQMKICKFEYIFIIFTFTK